MSSLFSSPSVPKPAPPPPPVQIEDKAVQEAAAEAARKRSRSRGFRSTLLSQSMSSQAPALQDTLGS